MYPPSFAYLSAIVCLSALPLHAERPPAPVVDTGQVRCYDSLEPIPAPKPDRPLYGQDAQYYGLQAAYIDNGDGTISDQNTGLMWSQGVNPTKLSLQEAEAIAASMTLGGHDDWRVPTIKELYSLIDFRGATGTMRRDNSDVPANAIPFINTDYFDFLYGDTENGERYIDAQWLSSNMSVSPIMDGMPGLFGVNFADGRIKCYGLRGMRGGEKKFYARYVRGRSDYGVNDYIDNGDGTVTDRSTGLTWAQADSGKGMNWEDALEFAESLELAGHNDWRLPNIKELQSLVDYDRSPDATNSPAINPIFQTSQITNEAHQKDFPYFWSSTTHEDGPNAEQAAYIAFGRAIGQMHGKIMDVHGAGAQRSDPKEGKARLGHGPQGDAQRVLNYVRVVRGGAIESIRINQLTRLDPNAYPQTIRVGDKSYQPKPSEYRQPPEPPEGMNGDHRGPPPPNGQRPPHGMGPPPF